MASGIQKNRNRLKRSAVMLVLTVILCFSQMPAAVFAAGENDSAETGVLTYITEVPGLTVHIYKVGTVDSQGKTKLDAEYEKYQLTQSDKTMAAALEAYLERDKVQPLETKTSEALGEKGNVRFESLQRGWYLLTGDVTSVNGTIYTQTPGLVTVPWKEPSGDSWDFTVEGKFGKVTYTELKAQKIWEDNQSASRPASIVVQLLCDGDVKEEKTLSAAGDWSCSWTGLDFTKKWAVVEKSVPSGYTAGMERNAGLVTLTNTKPGGNPPDDTKPDNGTKIPQTGQLWWPVPVLAFAGLVFLIIGLRRRSGSR